MHHTFTLPFDGWWLSGPLAVSMATVGMMATRTMHPPAGGTALIAASEWKCIF